MSLAAASDAPAAGEDPWPLWQRTANRLGNTQTIGPRTPNIAWSAPFTTDGSGSLQNGNLVIDRFGRLVAGSTGGLAMLHPMTHEIVWEQFVGATAGGLIGLGDGRVVIGAALVDGKVHCFDVATGEEHWAFDIESRTGSAPIIHNGVVYVAAWDGAQGAVYALDLADGSVLWSTPIESEVYDSPSLDAPSLLTNAGFPDASALIGLQPSSGEINWTFDTFRELFGTHVIHDDAVFVGSSDSYLYRVDATTGEEVWSFFTEKSIRGAVAIGHDGTIYTGTSGGAPVAQLFAVNPDGTEHWRFMPGANLLNSPIVGGNGHIYFTVINGSPREGFVYVFRPDGTVLWTIEMPDQCASSPTLGPDGTLYILCRDKNVYAFRDPHERMGIDNLEITTGTVLSGGVAELAEPDDEHLIVRSGFGRRLSEQHKMELIVRGEIETVQPHVLRLQLQSRISEPAGIATVRLRNWDTGAFETVAAYPLSEDEPFEWIQIPEGGNAEYIDPARYIHPFGQVELQLTHVVFAPFLAFQFESFIDQIKIEAAE